MPLGSVLLCAGRGSRLRPLTDHIPKPALPVLDIPLGAFSLVALASASPPVLVNVHHLGQQVLMALTPFIERGEQLQALYEAPEAYGTAGTLAAVRLSVTSTLLVAGGDMLADVDLRALVAFHSSSGARATAVAIPVDSGADFEVRDGRVDAFIDRRDHPDAPGFRFASVAAFEPAALELAGSRRPAGIGEMMLQPLVEAGELAAFVHDGYWLDCGTPERYLEANLDALAGRGPGPPREWPGEIVEVGGGRAYVGPAARVKGASLGPGSVVLEGAAVMPGAQVANAVVWPGEIVPERAIVEGCIWAFGRPI